MPWSDDSSPSQAGRECLDGPVHRAWRQHRLTIRRFGGPQEKLGQQRARQPGEFRSVVNVYFRGGRFFLNAPNVYRFMSTRVDILLRVS